MPTYMHIILGVLVTLITFGGFAYLLWPRKPKTPGTITLLMYRKPLGLLPDEKIMTTDELARMCRHDIEFSTKGVDL